MDVYPNSPEVTEGSYFRFGRKLSNCKPHLGHFQLRDGMCVTPEQDLYYTTPRPGEAVARINLQTEEITQVSVPENHDHGGLICCNVYKGKYLFAGTSSGNVYIKDLESGNGFNVKAAEWAMINSFNFHESSDGPRVLVSLNSSDPGMIAYSIPSMKEVCRLVIPPTSGTLISYCNVSPDGRYMVVVGDRQEIYLYDVLHGSEYNLTKTIKIAKNPTNAHIAVWSCDASRFAVAMPAGGCVEVYTAEGDLQFRFYGHIPTEEKPRDNDDYGYWYSNAGRDVEMVKWSPTNPSLLAFATSEEIVFVVNVDKLHIQQFKIEKPSGVSATYNSGPGALCFTPNGDKFYVSFPNRSEEEACIQEYVRVGMRSLAEICLDFIRDQLPAFKNSEGNLPEFDKILPTTLYDSLFLGHPPSFWLDKIERRHNLPPIPAHTGVVNLPKAVNKLLNKKKDKCSVS